VTDENIYLDWMRARLVTLIRYLSNDTHRLRMLPFVDDKSDDVGTYISQGLRPPELQPDVRPGAPQRPREDLVAAGAGEDVRVGHVGLTGATSDLEGQGRAGVAEGRRTVVAGAGAGDHVVTGLSDRSQDDSGALV
jgi:hypothetical protein